MLVLSLTWPCPSSALRSSGGVWPCPWPSLLCPQALLLAQEGASSEQGPVAVSGSAEAAAVQILLIFNSLSLSLIV